MQYKLAFIFALVVCSQALTAPNETATGVLYSIDSKRFKTLVDRIVAANVTEHRNYHLMNAIGSFAYTCEQLYSLLDPYPNQVEIIEAMKIMKNNVINPRGCESSFLKWFSESNKQNVTRIFNNMTACKAQGVAPEKFPVPALPYREQWSQTDLDALISKINKAYLSDEKLRIAQAALTSSLKVLSPDQTCLLYESFSSVADMLTLTEYVKEKLAGLTCDQVISLLNRFYFDDTKLEALQAFKLDIIDAENKLTILDSFRQPRTQALASKILADLKPKNYIFGAPTGNVLFLIDVSGSMDTMFTLTDGKRMSRLDFIKSEVSKTLGTLDQDSKFNVLSYTWGINIWRGYGLQQVTEDNIKDALNWTSRLVAYGGTDMYSPLQLAWTFSGVDAIYLLTDGAPNTGVIDTNKIVADIKTWYAKTPIKVNTIAFLMGTDSSDNKPASKKLMSAIAEATNGTYKVYDSDK